MEKASSVLLSLALHAQILFMIIFWPAQTKINLETESYQVSLVFDEVPVESLGARPTPIQAPTPAPTPAKPAPTPPAPAQQSPAPAPTPAPVPVPAPTPTVPPVPVPAEPKPLPPQEVITPTEPKIEEKPEPEAEPIAEPTPEPVAETVAEPVPTPTPVPTPAPKPAPSAAMSALADLEKLVAESAATSGSAGTSGNRAGSGGIYDVYVGNVMQVVRGAWSIPTYSRENLVARVRVQLDAEGKILNTTIEKASGRDDFDASALNALQRLGTLPAPPNADLRNIVLVFNSAQ